MTAPGPAPPPGTRPGPDRGRNRTRPGASRRKRAVVLATVAALVAGGAFATLALTGDTGHTPFAPYVQTQRNTVPDLTGLAEKTGVKRFHIGFVIAADGRCEPKWGGRTALDAAPIARQVDDLRVSGGEVRASFGGQAGTELALACRSVDALEDAYRQVIDIYGLTDVDFDIEGTDVVSDTAANTRRSQAIARLQKSHPGLDVTLTLSVTPRGMPPENVELLAEAERQGVSVSAVNIMAMHYGPSYRGDMGTYAEQAATASHRQVKRVLGIKDDDKAWGRLAVTAMIGVNDGSGEVFTLEDAAQLRRFADDKGLAWLSVWSVNRDRQCPEGTPVDTPHDSCSGVPQKDMAFIRAFG
ncbi:chitinase [Streptomyces sp. NPDC016309]|uniref:chitinase n=1 Tax=Streptomyces sp. NPDC016309 TaxID=3364965 RepID=UPI0036F7A013